MELPLSIHWILRYQSLIISSNQYTELFWKWVEYEMFLIVLFVIALIPAYIASAKGRDFAKWYIYGLLLWIVALPHAISLKEEGVIVCPACKSKVALEALICKYCQTKLDPKYKAEVISKKVEAKAKRKKRDLIGFSVLIVCVIIIVLILRQM